MGNRQATLGYMFHHRLLLNKKELLCKTWTAFCTLVYNLKMVPNDADTSSGDYSVHKPMSVTEDLCSA